MAAKLVYFGNDTCHRIPVLTRTGYFIENCLSLPQLDVALGSRNSPEAVVIADHDGSQAQEAIALARSRSEARLILFRDSNHTYAASDFDLVIANLTPPEQWLQQIAGFLEQSRLRRAKFVPARLDPNRAQRTRRLRLASSCF